jgi:hypothetical protein
MKNRLIIGNETHSNKLDALTWISSNYISKHSDIHIYCVYTRIYKYVFQSDLRLLQEMGS